MRISSLVCSGVTMTILVLYGTAARGATITSFDTRPAFTAASSSLTTINFEGIVPANASQNFPNPGLTTSTVTFSTSGTGPFGTGVVTVYSAGLAAMQSPVLNTGTGAILVWGPPNQPGTAFLNTALPAGTTAVGADFWAQQPFISAVDIIVNAADATTQTFTVNTVNRPTASFIGFTSDVAITSVLFRTPQGQTGLVVDNFSFGQSSTTEPVPSVPEPITALLVGVGLVGVAAVRKCA
jgi:hypothetical protein